MQGPDPQPCFSHANVRGIRWVQTEMGNTGAKAFGLESAPDTLEASISGLVKLVSDMLFPFSGRTRSLSEV